MISIFHCFSCLWVILTWGVILEARDDAGFVSFCSIKWRQALRDYFLTISPELRLHKTTTGPWGRKLNGAIKSFQILFVFVYFGGGQWRLKRLTSFLCVPAPQFWIQALSDVTMCAVAGSTLWNHLVSNLQVFYLFIIIFLTLQEAATAGSNMLFSRGLSRFSDNQSFQTWTQHFSSSIFN